MLKAGLATQTEGPGAAGPRFTPPPVGEIAKLFPQLEILRLIGQGGMGAVYKARQPALDRFVALKVLPPTVADDPGFAERFNREARALARLNHPNIVAVHDFGKAGSLHYLLMEFVDGANLREVERLGELKPEQALAIVPQICEALQFAHNEGIVHRDIKPENLLLDKKGRVKITDFGIAKMVGAEIGQQNLTGAKDVVGTPHYMAPEQIEKPLTVDHRADIYSLGVVFYEMLTGELPLGKFQPPSQKVQVDVRLDEVVLHALEKEPERRYQQASQVKTDVETIAVTGHGAVPPTAALDPGKMNLARAQVKGPAIGLVVTGVLDWAILTAACIIIAFKSPGSLFIWLPILAIVLSSWIIFAGLKFMQLERRGAVMVGSVLAMLVSPGNLIGLPLGIWALVVLNRSEVREAFEANRHDRNLTCNRSTRFSSAWKFAAFIFVLILSYELSKTAFSHLMAGHFLSVRSDYIGQAWFPQGDSIEITSVARSADLMTVRGHYSLVSHERALLALYITTMNGPGGWTKTDLKQEMDISKGRGVFELTHPHVVAGLPHVSMYADGHPFASLYFGTRAEALEESKASWITNISSASALQFRLVLPKDSTEPADDLPSASGNNRFYLSCQVLLNDTAIAQAGVDFSPEGRRKIEIRFTDAGAQKFEKITANNIGRQLAIVFRGQVLSAPVIQSVIPTGECQVDGLMAAGEINKIVDCLNRTATPTAEAWDFSPVHERILPFEPQPNALFGWLDLDSGVVTTNSSLDWESHSGYDWIRTNGLDVVTTESAKHFPTLLGVDMRVASAPINGWEFVTPADVVSDWALLQQAPQQKTVFGALPGQTDTFFFQTRGSEKGLLQILGFTDNPPGVEIRYKLVVAR
jgi:predicted Ser/Thr protein kinase